MTRQYARKPRWNPLDAGLRRRTLLGGLGTGLFLPVSVLAQDQCTLTPDSGEGPFYFDPEALRSDIRGNAAGAPLSITVRILRESDCALLEGARFDIWHADAMGLYSGYRNQPGIPGTDTTAAADLNYLRGTQFTDPSGQVEFHTVFPSWYGNRTPHIHFKVFLSEEEVVASQIFFPEEYTQAIYNNWQPYSEHVGKRRVTNAGDMFLRRNPIGGVFCDMQESGAGYEASAVVVVTA